MKTTIIDFDSTEQLGIIILSEAAGYGLSKFDHIEFTQSKIGKYEILYKEFKFEEFKVVNGENVHPELILWVTKAG